MGIRSTNTRAVCKMIALQCPTSWLGASGAMTSHVRWYISIKLNYAMIRYFKSYSAVAMLVITLFLFIFYFLSFELLHHFLPRAYSIMPPELVGSVHKQNKGSDRRRSISEYPPIDTMCVSNSQIT